MVIVMYEKRYKKIKDEIEGYKYGPQILRILNKITTTLVYLTYTVFLLILGVNKDPKFWKVLLISGISFILLSIFRYYKNDPRPYEVFDIVPIIHKDTKGKSFPSRHVFSVFVIAMIIYYITKPIGISLMLIGLIISVVRVLGGVHFPKDVIAGAIVGILSSIIGWNLPIF